MGLELLFQGSNIERLLNGLWVTAEIAFISVFFACILGVIFGVIMTSRNPIINAICRFYLEFVRIIPLLVLLFLAYFGLAKWFDIHLDGISVCILVFIFWGTAEMGDLVRGALTSIEKHQVESLRPTPASNQMMAADGALCVRNAYDKEAAENSSGQLWGISHAYSGQTRETQTRT